MAAKVTIEAGICGFHTAACATSHDEQWTHIRAGKQSNSYRAVETRMSVTRQVRRQTAVGR